MGHTCIIKYGMLIKIDINQQPMKKKRTKKQNKTKLESVWSSNTQV